jgi:hypothetical protein
MLHFLTLNLCPTIGKLCHRLLFMTLGWKNANVKKMLVAKYTFWCYIFHVINLMTLVSKSQIIHRPLPRVQGTTWDVVLTWHSLGKSRKCHKTEIWPIKAHKRGRLLKGHKHCRGDSFHLDPFSFFYCFQPIFFLSQISLFFSQIN